MKRKRLTAIALVFCMMTALWMIPAAALDSYIEGDADGDGVITVLDATTVQRVLAGLKEDPDALIALRGNVTSGGLNIMDATSIQRYLAGLEINTLIGTVVTVEEQKTEATQLPTQKPTRSYELPFIPTK